MKISHVRDSNSGRGGGGGGSDSGGEGERRLLAVWRRSGTVRDYSGASLSRLGFVGVLVMVRTTLTIEASEGGGEMAVRLGGGGATGVTGGSGGAELYERSSEAGRRRRRAV
jgi:hypothetical protein